MESPARGRAFSPPVLQRAAGNEPGGRAWGADGKARKNKKGKKGKDNGGDEGKFKALFKAGPSLG